MIQYEDRVGAAGARRPKAGHEDILTYYFSFSQQILDGLPFNKLALSRLLTTNFIKLS
jgi:hypothetical protein